MSAVLAMPVLPRLQTPSGASAVGSTAPASLFHSDAWCRILTDTYGFTSRSISLEGSSQPTLPILEVNSWLTGRRGVSLPFTDHCAASCRNVSDFAAVLAKVETLARQHRWTYWEYRGGTEFWPDAQPSVTYFQHHLALQSDVPALFRGCHATTRTAVRKAEATPLQVDFSTSRAAMRQYYRLACHTRQRHGLPPQPWAFFDNLQSRLLAAGHGQIALATLHGQPVAGAVFLESDTEAHYKFGASDTAFQELRPNNLIMWRAIEHYARRGFARLDFGRTSQDNSGLRRFKLGWGATESLLAYVRLEFPSRRFATVSDATTGRHTAFFRRLPQPLARIFGRLAYRHIA